VPDGDGDTTVTDVRGSDERLAEAFRAFGDTDDSEVQEDLRERIWLAVSGALPPEERRELVERTATDPGCAEVWRIASELWRASQAAAGGDDAVAAPGLATRWTPRWLAAAAVLLLGTALGVFSILNRPAGDEFRSSAVRNAQGSGRGFFVKSLVPANVALPRDAFRLRWTRGSKGSRYQVRVTTEDLQVLAVAADLTEPEFTVEPAVLSRLPGGVPVLWQVEVSLPNGERLTSSTFSTRVK
jgi:hypothetical protein